MIKTTHYNTLAGQHGQGRTYRCKANKVQHIAQMAKLVHFSIIIICQNLHVIYLATVQIHFLEGRVNYFRMEGGGVPRFGQNPESRKEEGTFDVGQKC